MKSVNRKTKKTEGYKKTKLGLIPMEWEMRTFGEIVKLSQYGLSIPTTPDGNYFMFKMNHFLNGKMMSYGVDRVKIDSKEFKKYKLNKEDILFNRTNSYELVGKTAIFLLDGDYTAASYIIRFVINREIADPYFVNYFFNWNRSQLKLKDFATKGVSQSNINPTNLQKFFLLPIPPLPEQQKITRILSTWDKAIEKTEQLIAQKQQLKKGLMQQLLTGKIRFKEFVKSKKMKKTKLGLIPEDWEVRILNDLCMTFQSGFGITSESIDEEGKYAVYGGNGLRGYTDSFTHDGEFVLIGRQGALCGNIVKIEGKNYVSEHAIAVQTNQLNDNQFLAYKLEFLDLNRFSESSAQPGLSVNKLLKLKISTPGLNEQKKIASSLSLMDRSIIIYSHHLTELKVQKKGLMQQLLTGQIRVKVN